MTEARQLIVFHPSPNLVPAIDTLLAEKIPAQSYKSWVFPNLLARAVREGITGEITAEVQRIIEEIPLAPKPLVLCTCSTLGGLAEDAGRAQGKEVIRIDRPMAEEAVQIGGTVAIAAALESTVGPTRRLLEEVANAKGVQLEIEELFCPGAWRHKERGDDAGYIASVVEAIEPVGSKFDVIVLAQGSMAPAKARLGHLGIPILTSPESAVDRIRVLLSTPS